MSLGGLVDLAVVRGGSTPVRRNRFKRDAEPARGTQGEQDQPAALGVLLSVIPVELIALYTAFITGIQTQLTPSAEFLAQYKKDNEGQNFPYSFTRDLIELRWAVYIVCVLAPIGIVYFGWKGKKAATDNRRLPLAEMFAGVTAMAVWGLVMPAGLLGSYVESSELDAYCLGIATIAAVLLLSLGLGTLSKKSKKTSS
jgi:hypothetical protein